MPSFYSRTMMSMLGLVLSSLRAVAVRALSSGPSSPPPPPPRPFLRACRHAAFASTSASTISRPRASTLTITRRIATRHSLSSYSSSSRYAASSAWGEPTTQSSQSPKRHEQQRQLHFMESDTVLVTDMDDNILLDVDPSMSSKMITHRFTMSNPRGILHRAFSVFLFDVSTSQLLLQKRASTKITFPNVWTNTCCSHPLLGMDPPESELEFTNDASSLSTDGGGEGEVTNNRVKGAMNAAIRKLRHELGIPTDELSNENGARFKYLTRVHYWAADTITHGMDSPWGEHEIDYILFVTVPNRGCLTLNGLNDDEVDDVRWVDRDTMRKMFDDETLLFSPWFRIIANRWLMGDGGDGTKADGWWHDLDRTMNTNDLCDHVTIHRFDPPPEHMGGAGDAGPMFID